MAGGAGSLWIVDSRFILCAEINLVGITPGIELFLRYVGHDRQGSEGISLSPARP